MLAEYRTTTVVNTTLIFSVVAFFMTQSRRKHVSLQNSRYYHLISRCVRRAYLCAIDLYNQQHYEHRRQWMVDRIRFLISFFDIDVAAYAVMSNN